MYIAYKHYDQISLFAQRIALDQGDTAKMTFFDPVSVSNDYTIMGFSVNTYALSLVEAERLVKDLDAIHVNRRQFGEEKLFIVGTEDAVQAWYDMMTQGDISTRLIRRYGGLDNFLLKGRSEDGRVELNKSKHQITMEAASYTSKKDL